MTEIGENHEQEARRRCYSVTHRWICHKATPPSVVLGLDPIGANLAVDVRWRVVFAVARAADEAAGRWRSA
ncbi:hypothetical protein JOH51_004500 [Rhizobium leguminosarum]|nr:hypothetical protein [Rhizobium leguminosarum]